MKDEEMSSKLEKCLKRIGDLEPQVKNLEALCSDQDTINTKFRCAITRTARRTLAMASSPVQELLVLTPSANGKSVSADPPTLGGSSHDALQIIVADGSTVTLKFHDIPVGNTPAKPINSPFLGYDTPNIIVNGAFAGFLIGKGSKEYAFGVYYQGRQLKITGTGLGGGSDPEIIIDDDGSV